MEPNQQPRGYDVTAQARQVQALIAQLTEKMQLRKWAVERAVEIVTAEGMQADAGAAIVETIKGLTEYFHDFASKPALEAIASVEPKPLDAA